MSNTAQGLQSLSSDSRAPNRNAEKKIADRYAGTASITPLSSAPVQTSDSNFLAGYENCLPGCSPADILRTVPVLVRSVPGWVLVSGFGWRFGEKYSQESEIEYDEESDTTEWKFFPRLSESVKEIDTFVSYTWKAPSFDRLCALCFHFNFLLAIYMTLAASLVVIILIDFIPYMHQGSSFRWARDPRNWCVWCFCLVLLLGHCFGQRYPSVFFDRMCISQVNDECQGLQVLCLNELVSRSKNILSIWSPTYFERLWCVYEMGIFLGKNSVSNVRICFPSESRLLMNLALYQIFLALETTITGGEVLGVIFGLIPNRNFSNQSNYFDSIREVLQILFPLSKSRGFFFHFDWRQ